MAPKDNDDVDSQSIRRKQEENYQPQQQKEEIKKGDTTPNSSGTVEISFLKLVVSTIPLFGIAGVCWWYMDLPYVSASLLVGCCRTLIQLILLGCVLKPIFTNGNPWLVLAYSMFMILLASYEASSRTKYIFDGQLVGILLSLSINIAWVSWFAIFVILRPKPFWNPRYVIPIVGMLLGNSISGISLSLDSLTKLLVEGKDEIELYLAFGATKWEAISRLFGESIAVGTTPILNNMRIIGLISIPGMMTGQILGGSSAMTAAKYQIFIIFSIAMATVSVILSISVWAVHNGFDAHYDHLLVDRFQVNHQLRVAGIISSLATNGGQYISTTWNQCWNDTNEVAIPNPSTSSLILRQYDENDSETTSSGFERIVAKRGLEIRSLQQSCPWHDQDFDFMLNGTLEVVGLGRTVHNSNGTASRILFDDVTFSVGPGDLLHISGPSGTGKSTLLKMIAGLHPLNENGEVTKSESDHTKNGQLLLGGKSLYDHTHETISSSAQWRRHVRYVTQTKVNIPGTPADFMNRVALFRSWQHPNIQLSITDWTESTSNYLIQWGLNSDSLHKDWSILSGGEAQRVLVALALASKPAILLLDECTSALDEHSKTNVENSVKRFIQDHHGGACWVSHDKEQAERMSQMDNDKSLELVPHSLRPYPMFSWDITSGWIKQELMSLFFGGGIGDGNQQRLP